MQDTSSVTWAINPQTEPQGCLYRHMTGNPGELGGDTDTLVRTLRGGRSRVEIKTEAHHTATRQTRVGGQLLPLYCFMNFGKSRFIEIDHVSCKNIFNIYLSMTFGCSALLCLLH